MAERSNASRCVAGLSVGPAWPRNSSAARSAGSGSAAIDRTRAILLRQLAAVVVEHERQVQHSAGVGRSEQMLQKDLARRRIEQVGAAHDFGDPLRGIVDDDRELIREPAVGAPHDEIADLVAQVLRLRP